MKREQDLKLTGPMGRFIGGGHSPGPREPISEYQGERAARRDVLARFVDTKENWFPSWPGRQVRIRLVEYVPALRIGDMNVVFRLSAWGLGEFGYALHVHCTEETRNDMRAALESLVAKVPDCVSKSWFRARGFEGPKTEEVVLSQDEKTNRSATEKSS